MSTKTSSAKITTDNANHKTIEAGPLVPARGSAKGIANASATTVTMEALGPPGPLSLESPGAGSGVGATAPSTWTGDKDAGFTIVPATQLWDPTDLAVAPLGFFDFTNNSTITYNGGDAAQVDDLSGRGNHAVQATATRQPTISTAPNGQQALRIGPTNGEYLRAPIDVNGLASAYLLMVASRVSNFVSLAAGDPAGGALNKGLTLFLDSTTNEAGSIYGFTSGFAASNSTISTGIVCVVEGKYDGANLAAWTDATSGTPATQTGNIATTRPTTDIGVYSAGASTAENGYILCALILGYAPTTDEQQRIQGWAHWHYGIQSRLPSGHPYKNAPPTI